MQNGAATVTASRTRLPWVLIGIFMILLGALLYARVYADDQNKLNAEAATFDRLNAITGLKREQISAWLTEQTRIAKLLSGAALVSEEIRGFLDDPSAEPNKPAVMAWLSSIRNTYGYTQVFLVAADGEVLASAPGDLDVEPGTRPGEQGAIQSAAVGSSGLYLNEHSQPVMDIYSPLRVETGERSTAAALLVLRVDPASELFPLVNSWPSPTQSSETLLIQQQDQDVVLLNQPLLSRTPPLTARFQLGDSSGAISQAALRKNGTGKGVDYRGVPVFFSFKEVPLSNWILVVKVDQEEIYSPLAEQNNLISLLTVALYVGAMLAAVLITRQREVQYYREQYLAEVRRQALSEHLMFISRYANDIILLTDEYGNVLEANDRAVNAYGYPADELHKLNLYQLTEVDCRVDLANQLQSASSLGGLVFEAVHQRSDGNTFPVECSARLIEVDDKRFYQTIIRDITERKQAEEKLRESERRFRLFYEQAPISYQSLDQEGCITDVNQAWTSAFGFRRAEVIGKPFIDFLNEGSRGRWLAAMQELRTSGVLRGCEVEMHCSSGVHVIVSITGRTSYEEGLGSPLLHCVLNDITEQRIAAAQIQRMNEELEKRVLDRTAQLEAANKELEAFSYSVSHDLRAPLRAIDGFTRIVIEDYASNIHTDASRYLKLVRDNARTMSNLIDNLLTFSRLSRHPLNKQRIDPNELVREALQALTSAQECRQIKYMLHTLPGCDADPVLLRQVFINLLSNAIKFTGKIETAVIEVGYVQEGRETIYYVKDNGIGFDMQYAPKLFGVFQRLHRVEDYEGTGVGLAIVQRIIHRHGGRVWAMGEVNQGATFCFTLEETNHHD